MIILINDHIDSQLKVRHVSTQFVSTQFRAYPFERALFSALNQVSLIN